MQKPQMLVMDILKIHDQAYKTANWVSRNFATSIEWQDDDSWVANILYPLWWLSKGNARDAGIKFPTERFDQKRYRQDLETRYGQYMKRALKLAHSNPNEMVAYLNQLEQQQQSAMRQVFETTKRIKEHSDVVINGMEGIIRATRMVKTSCDLILTVANPGQGAAKLALFFVGTGYGMACDFITHATKNPDKIDLLGFATDQALNFVQGKALNAGLDSVAGAFKAKFCDEAFKMANEAHKKYESKVKSFMRQGGTKAKNRQIKHFVDQKKTSVINGRVTHRQWKILRQDAKQVQGFLDHGNKNEKIIDKCRDYAGLSIELLNMREDIGQFGTDVSTTVKELVH